jgi:hypothetical protein
LRRLETCRSSKFLSRARVLGMPITVLPRVKRPSMDHHTREKKNLPSFAMSGFESYKGQSIYLAHPLPGRDLGDSFVIFLERALTFWCCVSESGRGRFFFGHSRLWQLAILMPVGRSAEEGHRTNEDAIRPYAGEIVDGVLFAEGSSIWRLLVQRSPVPPDWHQL